MTIAFSIVLSLLIAETLCVIFYLYTRPDRAIRQAQKEGTEFIRAAALKLLNRAWAVQGAPAMDSEFDDDDEKPALSNRAIEDLMPEEAEEKLAQMRAELEEIEHPQKRSEGSIAKRRRLVGDIARLQTRQLDNPPRPRMSPVGDAPYMNTLEPEAQDHLTALREN